MKRKSIKLIIIILVFAVPVSAAIVIEKGFNAYDYYTMGAGKNWEEEFFGKETYAELKFACSDEDFEAVQPVLDLAEEAFSYLGNDKDEAYKKFGKLGYYSISHKGLFSESHTLDFITARLDNNSGYMLIVYSQTGYEKNDKLLCGSGGVKARWTLEKTDSEWVVTKTLEHP